MASVTKRIRRNMMEEKHGFRTSMGKIRKMQKRREVEARTRADTRSLWDKVKEV